MLNAARVGAGGAVVRLRLKTADIVRKTGETWAPLIKRLNIKLD